MGELAYGDDHRHSLAPIHTSNTTSRKNVTTLNLLLNDVYHESISSLANYDHHNIQSFQVSPPSSATSSTSSTLTHVSFFHTSASTPSKGQLFTKSNSNSSMYTITSLDHHHHNMMTMRRPHGAGGLFQSFLGTSRKAPTPRHRGGGGPMSPPTTNVFTMMPVNVVGKKKPPGYVSDEPTSPEVTCMGRVRRNKHCKAWDALVVDMEMAEKCYNASGSGTNNSSGIGSGSGSKPRLRYRGSTPRSSSVAMNCSNVVVVPRPLPQPAMFNRWKAFLGNMAKDMKLHIPNLTTKIHKLHRSFTGRSASGCAPAVEDFVIADLLRRRARASHPGRRSRRSSIKDVACASHAMEVVKQDVADVSGPKEEKQEQEQEEGYEVHGREKVDKAMAPNSIGLGRDSYFSESEWEVSAQENSYPSDMEVEEKPSLPNCLRLMRNTSRRKVFHSNDDDDADDGDGDGDGDGDEHDIIGTYMKGVHPSHDGDQCHVGYNSDVDVDDDNDDDGDDDGDDGHDDDVDRNKNVLMSRNNLLARTSDTVVKRPSSKGIKNLFGRRSVNQHG